MASKTPRIDTLESSRNLAINSAFDFFQRGTSVTLITGQNRVADRFSFAVSGSASMTGTTARSTDVPTLAQSGYMSTYSLDVTATAGLTVSGVNRVSLGYLMEGYDYAALHARKGRVQFWIKAAKTGTFSLFVANSTSTRIFIKELQILAANTWEKKVVDLAFDDQGTWLFDNNMGVQFHLYMAAGSSVHTSTLNQWYTPSSSDRASPNTTNFFSSASDYVRITQFSILPGEFPSDADIPFTRAGRTIADELAMCQRYYQKAYNADDAPGSSVAYYESDRISHNFQVKTSYFKVPMRAAPSVTVYTPGGVSGSISTDEPADKTVSILTLAQNYFNWQKTTADSTGLQARWLWAASAEL